jgi:hypothetical protein
MDSKSPLVHDPLHVSSSSMSRPRLDNWSHLFESVSTELTERIKKCESRSVIQRRVIACSSRLRMTGSTDGDARYKKINEALDQMGLQRTDYQRQFHRMVLVACMAKIYGSHFDMCRSRIMKEHGIKEFRSEVFVVTPRRYGKTTMVAMVVAVLLVYVPGIKVCIFSTGKRASTSMLSLVASFIHKLGQERRIVRQNQEELYICEIALSKGTTERSSAAKSRSVLESTSTLKSFPASEKGFFFFFLFSL